MKVAFCLYKKALNSSISIAADMLLSAASLRGRNIQRSAPLKMFVIGDQQDLQKNTFSAHLNIQHNYSNDSNNDYDIIFFPPIWGNPIPSMYKQEQIIDWVNRQYTSKATFIATGTGVCWLATAGVMDNKIATTHWHFYDVFEKLFPKVQLNRKATITNCDNIYCVRSINSQTELLIYIIAQYFGVQIAQIIEKNFLHEASNFQSEPFFKIKGNTQFNEIVSIAQAYIKQNLTSHITLQDIAEHVKVSQKTLTRKFKDEIGITPHKYTQLQKLQTAKSLLKDNNLTLIHIAQLSGFKDPHYFKTVFEREFQVTPLAYRKLVKAKPFQA